MNSAELRNTVLRDALPRAMVSAKHIHWQTKVAGILLAVLLAAPRTRVVFVAPIYMIDLLAFILLISPLAVNRYRWVPTNPFSQLVYVYLVFMVISELRGMLAYGSYIQSVYMVAVFGMATSVFFTLPRLVGSKLEMLTILKGIVLGTLISAIIVIMYSLGPLRPLVVNTLYTIEFINPGWQELLRAVEIFGAGEAAMRGRSLVGAATLTAGFLATTWPLAFLAYKWFERSFVWKRIALATIIVAPVGILMTYGRGAWIMVGLGVALIAVFGLASGRRVLLMALAGAAILFTQFNINSDLFYMERLINETQKTIDSPFADVSTAERLLSYVQPFAHLAGNPVWFLAGAGRAGSRVSARGDVSGFGGQLYDEGGQATHSAFAMSYYSFGLIAALCQVVLLIQGFLFTWRRMRAASKLKPDQQLVWQSLFMAWCMYALFWGSGHGVVGEPRGVMLTFMMYGLLVAFEKLRIMELPPRPQAPKVKTQV